jgi:hypothetical protein
MDVLAHSAVVQYRLQGGRNDPAPVAREAGASAKTTHPPRRPLKRAARFVSALHDGVENSMTPQASERRLAMEPTEDIVLAGVVRSIEAAQAAG